MNCKGTHIEEIACLAKVALDEAATEIGPEAYNINVFFQEYEQEALDNALRDLL